MLTSRITFPNTVETASLQADRASCELTSNSVLLEMLEASAPPIFVHRVPLVNYKLDRSIKLDVTTTSEAFTEVLREVSYLRGIYGLVGYTIDPEAEIEQISTPF